MHRVKGLEFDHMVIASVNKGIVPLPAAAYGVDRPERAAADCGTCVVVCGCYACKEGAGSVELRGSESVPVLTLRWECCQSTILTSMTAAPFSSFDSRVLNVPGLDLTNADSCRFS